MSTVLVQYLAGKVLADIRAGAGLDDGLATELHARPHIDVLRNLAGDQDMPALLEIAEHGSLPARKLAVGILRSRKDVPQVRKPFFKLWDTQPDVHSRLNLMWCLLDYEDLDDAWHRRLHKYVCDNWDAFLAAQVGFMGGGEPAKVLPNMKDRLGDPAFPPTKAWAYLCLALASDDKLAVADLLKEYETSNDVFTASVVRDLLTVGGTGGLCPHRLASRD